MSYRETVCPGNACRGCERFTEALEEYDRAAELAERCSGAALSESDIQVRRTPALLHTLAVVKMPQLQSDLLTATCANPALMLCSSPRSCTGLGCAGEAGAAS